MEIYSNKTDLIIEKNKINTNNNDVETITYEDNDKIYKTIYFNDINKVKNVLKNELLYFFKELNIKKGSHIFIIGIGNDNYTADSVGPKTLKHVKVNSFLENFGIKKEETIVSSLEPGVLGETGILTEKIIKSVSNEIKPDLIILIDSFVSSNIDYLNKTIEITNSGISTGTGIKGINSNIDETLLGIPIISIGVTTALEIKFSNKNINYIPYILSTKDVDTYIDKISRIIGYSLNEVINGL
ncbi:MAG: GPR endopeptidase [Bacilli bacterium]|nr:GPR endopeptidase [Bacilli bacterium]